MGKDWRGSILLCLPTFGYIHVGMFSNLHTQEVPIHRSVIWHLPVGLPVAEARNSAVEKALEVGSEYVYFRDYDVLAPPTGLGILMARDADVVGGMYCSKQKPPVPLIIKDNRPTLDWEPGDMVKCDGIGMGCTLIKTDVFTRMTEPWFETSHVSEDDKPCHSYTTEDMYFCNKLHDELGLYPYCDTAVSCVHIDFESGDRYYFSPDNAAFVWHPKDAPAMFIPPITHPDCRITDLTKESETE